MSSELKVESVTTKSISIVDDSGKEVATLTAANGGGGLWIKGPNGDLIAIYAIKGQTAIGIYDKEAQQDAKGMNLALTIADGEPTIQYRDKNGDPRWVSLKDIVRVKDKS